MICPSCEHANTTESKFCARCGARVRQYPRLKNYITIAIAAVVVAAAAVSIIPRLGDAGRAVIKDWIEVIDGDGEVIISGNNNARITIVGDLISYDISMDCSKAVVLVGYDDEDVGDLWFVTTSSSVKIAGDVSDYFLADTGNGVAYITDYNEKDETAFLYLYDTSGNKKTLVSDYATSEDGEMFGVAVSPDGRSIGYITDFDKSTFEFTGRVSIDGKTSEVFGDNMMAIAISNKGKHIYYVKVDAEVQITSLRVRSGAVDNRLATNASQVNAFIFNKDYSQILFTLSGSGNKTYISKNGEAREKIDCPAVRSLVMPRGTQSRVYYSSVRVNVYGVSSFSSFTAVTGESLVHYGVKRGVERVSASSSNAYRASISNNGKTLFYINDSGRLSSVKFTAAGAVRNDIDEDVSSFAVCSDGRSVYYVNGDNDLYFAKRDGTNVKIADNVLPRHLALSYRSDRAYFIVDYDSREGGELYFSDNGGRKEKVAGAYDVTGVYATPVNVFYVTADGLYFRSNGNESFSLLYDSKEILTYG